MKWSIYNIEEKIDGNLILYNTKNEKYVLFDDENELEHYTALKNSRVLNEGDYMVDALLERGYIVNDDYNEYEHVKNEIEQVYKIDSKNLSIMLYVTENCNFRCVYCPERHLNKRFPDKKWEALYKFIYNGVKQKEFDSVRIDFFGGEPLLEFNNILKFLEKLNSLKEINQNLELFHSITSNAYLLTPAVYDNLVKYSVLQYQLTLDGFEKEHNTTRPLANGEGTWQKIVENLKYINSKVDDAKVILSANVSPININTLEDFQLWTKDTFDNDKIFFDFNAVTKFSKNVDDKYVIEENSEYGKRISELKISNNRGYSVQILPIKRLSAACIGAKNNWFSISVEGNVSKCQHFHTDRSYAIGSLNDNGDIQYYGNAKRWFADNEIKKCKSCLVYPICGARKCPMKKATHPIRRIECAPGEILNDLKLYLKYIVEKQQNQQKKQ